MSMLDSSYWRGLPTDNLCRQSLQRKMERITQVDSKRDHKIPREGILRFLNESLEQVASKLMKT